MVLRFGRFFARSMIATRVPMIGPSTEISAKMPAAWLTLVWVSLVDMAFESQVFRKTQSPQCLRKCEREEEKKEKT